MGPNPALVGARLTAIVYSTDLYRIDDVVVLDEARGDWAPTPQVVFVRTRDPGEGRATSRPAPGRTEEDVEKLRRFLASAEARAIFRRHGFGTP